MKNTLKTILLALIPGLIYLTGCTHSTPTPTTIDPTQLVGVWTYSTLREVSTYHSHSIYDTTEHYNPGATIEFLSSGRYIVHMGTVEAGLDSLSGNKLYVTDTTASGHGIYTVQQLTAHSLVLDENVSYSGSDTIIDLIFSFTR